MADTVLYEVSDGLATITLNRPEAMNALNIETKVALRDAVQAAAGDDAVRAVLLTAAGERAFCVGQDLKEHIGLLISDRETGSGQTMSTVREHYNPIVRALAGMSKPVVAGVNGVAAGAGFGFALAADYRVVADTAAFNTSFAGVALTADSGISWTLPRVVGPGRAADLLLFPRTIKAQEAYELGIANRLVPAAELRAEAEKVARALAGGRPWPMGRSRRPWRSGCRTHSRRPWRRRTSCRRGPGLPRTMRSRCRPSSTRRGRSTWADELGAVAPSGSAGSWGAGRGHAAEPAHRHSPRP